MSNIEEVYSLTLNKRLFIENVGADPSGSHANNRSVNLMFELDDEQNVTIIIQAIKESGKAFEHRAKIPKQQLESVLERLE